MKFDQVSSADRLIGVETPVADRAEMGGLTERASVDFFIPQGRESVLEEAGTHVRLVGLNTPLQVARSYPLKLTFEKGGVVSATLNIDYEPFL